MVALSTGRDNWRVYFYSINVSTIMKGWLCFMGGGCVWFLGCRRVTSGWLQMYVSHTVSCQKCKICLKSIYVAPTPASLVPPLGVPWLCISPVIRNNSEILGNVSPWIGSGFKDVTRARVGRQGSRLTGEVHRAEEIKVAHLPFRLIHGLRLQWSLPR